MSTSQNAAILAALKAGRCVDVEFANIPDLPGYAVGDDGSVWCCRNRNGSGIGELWRPVKAVRSKGGYLYFNSYIDGGCRHNLIHICMLKAFRGESISRSNQTRHKNGERSDNRLSNLESGTAKDNAADRERHGTNLRGSRTGMAKLTETQVMRIVEMISSGLAQTKIAIEFGVTSSTVSHIKNGRTWTHVYRMAPGQECAA